MTYRPRSYWHERALEQGPSYVGPGGDPERTEEQRRLFEALIDQELGKRPWPCVLDFGCGSGRLSDAIASHTRFYLGVDISQEGIRQARITHSNTHSFVYLSQDALPFGEGAVSLVVAITVFQHINPDDFRIWAREIRRVLHPEGAVFLVDEPDDGTPSDSHVFRRKPEEYEEAFDMTYDPVENVLTHHQAAWLVPR